MVNHARVNIISVCHLHAGGVNVLYEDNLGIVDFHPTNDVGVIYLSEANLVTGSSYKRKLVKLRKVC